MYCSDFVRVNQVITKKSRNFVENNLRRFLIIATLLLAPAIYTYAQSPAGGPWSGSIQCQLDVQLQSYVRHEVQTWTLTGELSKAAIAGNTPKFGATWTYTGQGGFQRIEG